MWVFLFLLITFLQSVFSYYLFTKIKAIQNGTKSKRDKDDIILPKLKDMPKIEDLDTDSQFLKDILESAKLEGWKCDIKEEIYPFEYGKAWRININNTNNTLTINTVLRTSDSGNINVGYFTVGGVSFNCEENKLQKYLIVEYLWRLIVEKKRKGI